MLLLLNNCRNRPHATYYPSTDGQIAFYDLDTEGHQATKAVGLGPGTECIVVSRLEGRRLRFQRYSFAREEVRPAPPSESGLLRVFFGRPVRPASKNAVRSWLRSPSGVGLAHCDRRQPWHATGPRDPPSEIGLSSPTPVSASHQSPPEARCGRGSVRWS